MTVRMPQLRSPPVPPVDPPLRDGMRLSRAEFHRRYEAMPDIKAELIGGVVRMASPMKRPHAVNSPMLSTALVLYSAATPGTEVVENATVILADDSEPQPDLILRITDEFGGLSHVDDDEYLVGPPELIIEVSHATERFDLGGKREAYARAGVREYLVLSVAKKVLRAFDLAAGAELPLDPAGVHRSRVFPGLWIATHAVTSQDARALMNCVNLGLASPEHAAFVVELEKRRKAVRRRRNRKS